jgi:ATP-dependent DNA ligase
LIDGEAVILGVDGVPDFNVLHSRKHDDEVKPYAFDILTLDGEDLRPLPLSLRKTNLARLLARRPFSCSPGTGALRRDRARERGGRAAAWSTIHADNPTPSPSGTTAMSARLSLPA